MIPVCFISVLYYTCVEEICDGKVEFDGSELALLNIIIIIVNLYWGCQHHRKSGLQKGPLKVTTNQYNYVKM